jgi:hypothetical protein
MDNQSAKEQVAVQISMVAKGYEEESLDCIGWADSWPFKKIEDEFYNTGEMIFDYLFSDFFSEYNETQGPSSFNAVLRSEKLDKED